MAIKDIHDGNDIEKDILSDECDHAKRTTKKGVRNFPSAFYCPIQYYFLILTIFKLYAGILTNTFSDSGLKVSTTGYTRVGLSKLFSSLPTLELKRTTSA